MKSWLKFVGHFDLTPYDEMAVEIYILRCTFSIWPILKFLIIP